MMASAPDVITSEHAFQASKGRYRPEIDGLRAFAVIAVIIDHFNKGLLPGGYLGVDIFFVISGYVITSSLAGRQSKNFRDFLTGFYDRRIKRLVPALVVFVLITSVLICLFNPDPKNALGLGWRSLFGISNINLYQTSTDHFAQSTELNPFTHTWSLGVEEQFYVLFPFLIWFSGFGRQPTRRKELVLLGWCTHHCRSHKFRLFTSGQSIGCLRPDASPILGNGSRMSKFSSGFRSVQGLRNCWSRCHRCWSWRQWLE
jgi:peptidoglycan/LPS O-acetylase OafA/YrhL